VWEVYPDTIHKEITMLDTEQIALDERIYPAKYEVEAEETRLVDCGTCITGGNVTNR
jgi:hypothetical protein